MHLKKKDDKMTVIMLIMMKGVLVGACGAVTLVNSRARGQDRKKQEMTIVNKEIKLTFCGQEGHLLPGQPLK